MPVSTDNRRELLTVIANMRARPGKEQELREALEALVAPTSQEDGYVDYALHQAVDDPAVFYFYENWESGEALDAHLATPHLVDFIGKMGDLLAEPGLTIARLSRIA